MMYGYPKVILILQYQNLDMDIQNRWYSWTELWIYKNQDEVNHKSNYASPKIELWISIKRELTVNDARFTLIFGV